jgi:hypothetical protein
MSKYYYKSEESGALLAIRAVDVPSLTLSEKEALAVKLVAAVETRKLEIYNSETGHREIWNGSKFLTAGATQVIMSLGSITTDLAINAKVDAFPMPFDGVLLAVEGSLDVAATGTDLATFDVAKNGVTMLSTKITLDATETNSSTATTPVVISVSECLKGDVISASIDLIGDTTPGVGGKITFYLLETS